MESAVKSEKVKTFFPTINEFKNFRQYIKTIEKEILKDSVRVAKVSE